MLNQAVVEQVLAIAKGGQSGALWLAGAGIRLRFCFQAGVPVALDLGRDKDALLADKLLEYNKIGPELHRMLGDVIAANQGMIAAGGSPVLDFLAQQQALAQGEAEQVTQSMVEDSLVEAFTGQISEINFIDGEDLNSFDFARSSLRIRIDASMLVATARARAEEDAAARHEIGTFDAVYSLVENEGGSAPLTEHERQVMDQIDGRRSVEDIGIALRDSSIRVARVIRVLSAKKVVRRVAGLGSRTRAALNAMKEEKSNAVTITIERDEPRRGLSPMTLGITVVGVALVGGLLWLVHDYNQRRSALEALREEILDKVAEHKFVEALDKAKEAESKAGNDLNAINDAKEIQAQVNDAIEREYTAINDLRTAAEFNEARRRLLQLPLENRRNDALGVLVAAEDEFKARSAVVEQKTVEALARDDVAAAIAAIDAASPLEAAKATESLDRWRIMQLEQANGGGVPIARRQALVAKVRSARPTASEKDRLGSIEQDIARRQAELATEVRSLLAMADNGDWKGAHAGSEALAEQVAGSSLEVDLKNVRSRCAAVETAISEFLAQSQGILRMGGARDLAEAIGRGQGMTKDLGQAPNIQAITGTVAALTLVQAALAAPTMAEQATALDTWIAQAGEAHPSASAVIFRRDQLRSVENSVVAAIETARKSQTDGNLEGALQQLESLVSRPEVRQTAASNDAEKLLADVRSAIQVRKGLEEELNKAMAAGDLKTATDLANRLHLPYLPLQVDSIPAGAEVSIDGKLAGRTPIVLKISAAERSETAFIFRLPGYLDKTLHGAAAEGGIRLTAALERAPQSVANVPVSLTGRPIAAFDRAWVATRSALVSIDASGNPTVQSLESAGGILAQPVYAPPLAADGGLYIPTRDGVCLRWTKDGIVRLPQIGRSDLMPAIYHSQVVLDRSYLIVAGDDRRIHAVNIRSSADQWQSDAGEPFAAGPLLAGDRILCVRTNGHLEALNADDGKVLATAEVGKTLSCAWVTEKGLAGCAGNVAWTWDGVTLSREDLPAEPMFATADILVTATGRVWRKSGGSWAEFGRVDGRPTGSPLRWGDHAVVPVRQSMVVVGPKPFAVAADSDVLDPVVLPNGNLLVLTVNGQIKTFAP